MKVLFTGGSSGLGSAVLSHLLHSPNVDEIACAVHRAAIPLQSAKLRQQVVDLADDFRLDASLSPIDLLIHFAAVTHAQDAGLYRSVNFEGSLRLVEQSRERGCRKMFYVSTRCVGPTHPRMSCGAYAESKRALEAALLGMEWDSLVILRPAEIYGAGGTEGIDQFIRTARTLRLVPMMFGDRRLRFAPVYYKDFVRITTGLLDLMPSGTHIYELCGPEVLNGVALARRLSKTFGALPIPLWYPMIETALRGLSSLGVPVIAPDQIDRLLCDKSSEVSSTAVLSQSRLTRLEEALVDKS
jgi:nucleoside-diphosphate-sugar epimerase